MDVALVNQPGQVPRIAIAGICREPLRPQAEALVRALDHSALGSDLGLADRRGCLHIDDHGMVEIDQVFVE